MSLLVGGAIGYVIGARAGHERYEQIVRLGRRVAGSQTVQSAAGVFRAQLSEITHKVTGSSTSEPGVASRNGASARS
ncbi:MAG: hypothetical protein J2P57_07000 [Acidimicrobiaceae bacterium]|nr:hypothetical protein [Acidimicrobiaceae bacterium]